MAKRKPKPAKKAASPYYTQPLAGVRFRICDRYPKDRLGWPHKDPSLSFGIWWPECLSPLGSTTHFIDHATGRRIA